MIKGHGYKQRNMLGLISNNKEALTTLWGGNSEIWYRRLGMKNYKGYLSPKNFTKEGKNKIS